MLTRDYELSVLSEGPGNVTQRQSDEQTSLVPTQHINSSLFGISFSVRS